MVQTDASAVGVGTVISQTTDGEEHLVLYISQKLFLQDQNYLTLKEDLSVKWAVKDLRYYLLREPLHHGDQSCTPQVVPDCIRHQCMAYEMVPFAFILQHQAGKENTNADGQSWLGKAGLTSPKARELDLRGVCV